LLIHSIDDKNIPNVSSYQGLKLDSLNIQPKLQSFIFELQNQGYLAASIDSIRFENDNVHSYLFLGRQFKWNALDFSRIESHMYDELNLERYLSEIIRLNDLNKMRTQLLNFYENNGFPFAQVQLQNTEIQDSIINTEIIVAKGDYYTLDSIIFKGDAKITKTFIRNTIKLKNGDAFNQRKIDQISKEIENIRFISEIKPSEIEFKEEQFDLYLYLENKKANRFNGIIGFLPESENESGKLLITGELNLNLVNSFGKGEEIYLSWERLESATQSLDIGFDFPFIFESNLGLDSDFSLFKKDSSYLNINTGLGLRLSLGSTDYIKAYYRYKNSSLIGDDESLSTSLTLADVSSNIVGAKYSINKLDYYSNPRIGFQINVFAGVGFKSISNYANLNDSLDVNTDNKTIEIESGLDLEIYYPIYKNFVFHFGNITRYLDQFGDSNKDVIFFENELYQFGGARSLRGFDENLFTASIYSLQNAEIRYLFEQNSAFYLFWNGAYYYKNVALNVTEDFPWGFGIGMDFETKAGIFSLSYALGKQFENPFEIRTAKIHFGYISRF